MSDKKIRSIIVLCPKCKGDGREVKQVSAYDSELVECSLCHGFGRVIKTVETTIEPFDEY